MILALGAGAAIAGVEARAQQFRQNPPDAARPAATMAEPRQQAEKPTAPSAPPRTEPAPPPPQAKDVVRKPPQQKDRPLEFTEIYGLRFRIGELLVAAFAAGLFLATLALWRTTRKLVREARDSSEQRLRAYLHVTKVEFRGSLGGEPKFFLEYANLGQTPAYGVAGWCAVELRDRLSDLPLLDRGEITRYGDIGPGHKQNFVKQSPRQFTSGEINDIISGASTIYFYGEFGYRDAFGKPRRTLFRRMLVDAASAKGERIHFGVCPEGDRTD